MSIGKDGVVQLFPTAVNGSTWTLDLTLSDPRKDSRFDFDGINNSATVNKLTEAGVTFFQTPGNPVNYKSGGAGTTIRIGSYASGGKNKTQTHNWDQKPDFLYNAQDIRNSEITVYVRGHGDLGVHKSCAFKIHGAPPDATRSLFETVFPISASDKVRANWNYAHFPYDPVSGIKQYFNAYWQEGKWVGLKHIHIVSADKKTAHNQLYADVDPFDSTGKPNNAFKLMAEWTDNGSPAYKGISCTWGAQVNKVRLDGYKLFDFTLFSDREVSEGPIPTPTPTPTIRTQKRSTTTGGDPVPDSQWIVQTDTGPLPVIGKETISVTDQAISTSGPINIILVAQDSDPTSIVTIKQVKAPAGGTLSAGTGNTYTYHPNTGFSGIDIFTYEASNNKGIVSNIGTVTITVSAVPIPPPETNVDKFGISKMYGDRQGTYNNWVQTTASDPRFFEGRVADSGNGWLKAAGGSTEIRIEVLSDIAANESTIPTFDVGKVIAKGYLYKPIDSADGKGDFGDFEMTWRVRGRSASGTRNGECHTELVPGGYRQTSDMTNVGKDKAVPAACEAMSYHFNCYPLTGRVKYEKDSMHTSGYTKSDPEKTNAIAKFDNMQEIIQKAVLYRTTKGVKLETYVDESGSGTAFKKVLEYEDSGQWGPTRGGNAPCNCGEYPILGMGRVALGYRGDNWTNFEFKDASIRSIDSSKALHAEAGNVVPHTRMVEEDIVRSDDKPSGLKAKGNIDEPIGRLEEQNTTDALTAKKDAETVANHAEDPNTRKQASTIARKIDV